MTPTELLLIRHGERADNIPSHVWNSVRHERPKDAPLTAKGFLQARRAGSHIASVRANVIYVSPLTRCLQTAAEIACILRLPVKIVYSLAKPCAYFRRTLRAGKLPVHANLQEATEVLRAVWSDIEVQGFVDDDRTSCVQTLEKLAGIAREQNGGEGGQVIVVGHCEAQKELAHMSGLLNRMSTPYGGIAVFEVEMRNGNTHWKLVRKPKFLYGDAPVLAATSNGGETSGSSFITVEENVL